MILHPPFQITSGLYPGVRIGDATIECREALQFVIYWDDGHEHHVQGFRPGAFADLQDCFGAIADFLAYWADCLQCANAMESQGYEPEGITLFPADDERLATWATENTDELLQLSMELEENDNLLE